MFDRRKAAKLLADHRTEHVVVRLEEVARHMEEVAEKLELALAADDEGDRDAT